MTTGQKRAKSRPPALFVEPVLPIEGPLTDRRPPAASGPCSRPVPTVHADTSIVAQASVPAVDVLREPAEGSALSTLRNPLPSGAPLIFRVTERRDSYFNVFLPVRPNGSTGWVRAGDVTVFRHEYRIVVELDDHCLTAFKGSQIFLREPVGIGRANTPTPGGTYYIKELYQPPNPDTTYGPFAYGLSGFSDALSRFQGGEAVIGIHGNNNPSSLGKDVSAGCIRMSNSGITKLARELPLGVPVEIRS